MEIGKIGVHSVTANSVRRLENGERSLSLPGWSDFDEGATSMVSSSSDSKPLSSPECLTQPPLLSIHFPAPLAISTDLPTFLTVTVLDLVFSLPLRYLNNLESASFLLEPCEHSRLNRSGRLQSTTALHPARLST